MTTRGARLEGMLRDRQMKMKLTTLLLLCAAPSWSFAPGRPPLRALRARAAVARSASDEAAEPAPSAEEILEYREDMARRRELLDGFFRRMMLSPETLAPADVERVVDECFDYTPCAWSVGGVEYGPDDDHFAAKALSLARAYGVGMDVALRFWGPADGEAAAASRARAAFAKAGFEGLKFDAQPIVAKGEARFIEMEGSAPLS